MINFELHPVEVKIQNKENLTSLEITELINYYAKLAKDTPKRGKTHDQITDYIWEVFKKGTPEEEHVEVEMYRDSRNRKQAQFVLNRPQWIRVLFKIHNKGVGELLRERLSKLL
jgi:hypothetical protein